ncbi:hypothetical protein GDO81_019569 [Engystomops pustulosus]|uniref:Uncharacterized protein n=1 Tax=Engystomops pustulosus TaxID=76066 RepID=A0AAV6Z9H2_ENGPU|nr:hypothetical protein GDO81_019569 [Engystomops pustulosus]
MVWDRGHKISQHLITFPRIDARPLPRDQRMMRISLLTFDEKLGFVLNIFLSPKSKLSLKKTSHFGTFSVVKRRKQMEGAKFSWTIYTSSRFTIQ